MAQQPSQAPPTSVVIWNRNTPFVKDAVTADLLQMMESTLAGNVKNLTPDRLLLDMCSYLNANPKVGEAIKPAGVMACLLNAGRFQTTFGDGGLWIIPDGKNPGGVRTQESRKFQVDRSREVKGVDEYRARLIYTQDQPVNTEFDERGEITGYTLSPSDITEARAIEDLVGVFVTTYFKQYMDSIREPRIFWWSRKPVLDQMRAHSAAEKGEKGKSMWSEDPEQAYELAAIAATARKILPVRTLVPGMPGDVILGDGTEREFIDITPAAPEPSTSDAAGDELLARAAATGGTATPPISHGQQESPKEPAKNVQNTIPSELPPLPDELQRWMESNEDTVIQRVILKVQQTVPNLADDPDALKRLFADFSDIWRNEVVTAGQTQGQAYGQFLNWLEKWGKENGIEVRP